MDFIEFVLSQLPPAPSRVRFSGRLATQEAILARYALRTEGPVDAAVLDVWEPDTIRAIERVAALLRPGGVFILELPIGAHPEAPARGSLYEIPLEQLRSELDARFDERVAEVVPLLERGRSVTLFRYAGTRTETTRSDALSR